MIVIQNTYYISSFPFWIVPFILFYLIGVIVSAKGVNRGKKIWQKIIFVVFWPFFLLVFAWKLLAFATDG